MDQARKQKQITQKVGKSQKTNNSSSTCSRKLTSIPRSIKPLNSEGEVLEIKIFSEKKPH